jgi:hypothetical protein
MRYHRAPGKNAPDIGWLFLYIFGGLPFGIMVLNAWTRVGGALWGSPARLVGFAVGFALVTYYWWPAWVQLARYGKPGTAPRQTWDERVAERMEEAKRNRPQV